MRKLLFLCLSIALMSPALSHAKSISYDSLAIDEINEINFEKKVTLHINGKNSIIYDCEETSEAYDNKDHRIKAISAIQFCKINLFAFKINQFYFFEKEGHIYFRQVKTFYTNIYEVDYIDKNEIFLGNLIAVE